METLTWSPLDPLIVSLADPAVLVFLLWPLADTLAPLTASPASVTLTVSVNLPPAEAPRRDGG